MEENKKSKEKQVDVKLVFFDKKILKINCF